MKALLEFSLASALLIVLPAGALAQSSEAFGRLFNGTGRTIEISEEAFGERAAVEIETVQLLATAQTNGEGLVVSPHDMVVTGDGTLFVADSGRQDVVVYAPDGTYVAALGRRGEGPGEFGDHEPEKLALAGSTLYAEARHGSVLQAFDPTERVFLRQVALPERSRFSAFFGLPSGRLIGVRSEPRPDAVTGEIIPHEEVVIVEPEGALINTLISLPRPVIATLIVPGRGSVPDRARTLPSLTPRLRATCFVETCYISHPLEYSILAYDAESGRAKWKLEVSGHRRTIDGEERDVQRAWLRDRTGGRFDPNSVAFKEDRLPAIDRIATDGHGNLYVFRWRTLAEEDAPDPRHVDVYSPDGTLIAAGVIHNDYRSFWYAAHGDFVYGLEADEETGDEIIAKRSLRLPPR